MDSKPLHIVDHLQKRNCQKCGAFILSNDEDEEEDEGSFYQMVTANEGVVTKVKV